MKTRQLFVKMPPLLLLCIPVSGLTACTQAAESGPRTWIDSPPDGSHTPAGTPLTLISHAYAQEGVAEMLLVVDGIAHQRDVLIDTESAFVKMTQEWLPQRPGTHTLQVRALNSAGEAISADTITVQVTDQIVAGSCAG